MQIFHLNLFFAGQDFSTPYMADDLDLELKSLSFMLDRTYPKDKLQTCNRDLPCTFMNSLFDHINLK